MQDTNYQTNIIPNKISSNGLRYISKEGSSTFGNSFASCKSTMSCMLCGSHTPRANGSIKKIFGKNHFVCYGCRTGKSIFTPKDQHEKNVNRHEWLHQYQRRPTRSMPRGRSLAWSHLCHCQPIAHTLRMPIQRWSHSSLCAKRNASHLRVWCGRRG